MARADHSAFDVFSAFFRLGLTSFGGPIAHLGFFRREFVDRRQWLGERAYADIVALCQFLPGPSSSQVGIALGFLRRGYLGALAAWFGFTLPSALLLMTLATSMTRYPTLLPAGALHGLKVLAAAVVAQAVVSMARNLSRGPQRLCISLLSALGAWAFPDTSGQISILIAAAACGFVLLHAEKPHDVEPLGKSLPQSAGTLWLLAFAALGGTHWLLDTFGISPIASVVWTFFRTGALVFGGGHVVLPVLHAAVVVRGWVSDEMFVAGYGATQSVPGPLFTFAAYLGAVMATPVSGWTGGVLCLTAIFAPSFFLVFGTLPHWDQLRRNPKAQAALGAVNAATVGILAAAFARYIWPSAIHSFTDVAFACATLAAINLARLPLWAAGIGCALIAEALSRMG